MVAFQMPRKDESMKLEVMGKLTSASSDLMYSIARLESASENFAILESIVDKLAEVAEEMNKLTTE